MADITKGWQQAAENIKSMVEIQTRRDALAAQKRLGDLQQDIAIKKLDLATRQQKLDTFSTLAQSGLAKFNLGPLAKELETEMIASLRDKPESKAGALTFAEQKELAGVRSGYKMEEIKATGETQQVLAHERGAMKERMQKAKLSVDQEKTFARLVIANLKEMADPQDAVTAAYNAALGMGAAPQSSPTKKVGKAKKEGLFKIGKRDVTASEVYAKLGKDQNTGAYAADTINPKTGLSAVDALSDYSSEVGRTDITDEEKSFASEWMLENYPELKDYIGD